MKNNYKQFLKIINKLQIEKFIIYLFLFIGIFNIASTSYLSVYGHHAWRQSDVISHILGFINYKDFSPYDKFISGLNEVYDIPIYQYIIAKVSILVNQNFLIVIRLFNCLLWLLTVYSGFNICKNFSSNNHMSPILFLCLFTVNPLLVHYYTVALPDLLSIAFSILGLYLFLKYNLNLKTILPITLLFFFATLIKSPISFVFLVFYFSYLLLNIQTFRINKNGILNIFLYLFFISFILFSVFYAENLRKSLTDSLIESSFEQDAKWYFGDLELRKSEEFKEMIFSRFNEWLPLSISTYLIFVALSIITSRNRMILTLNISVAFAFIAGWGVFSNVYFIHDYYQLPLCIIIILAFAVNFSTLISFIISKISYIRYQEIIAKPIYISISLFLLYQLYTQDSFSLERSSTSFFKIIEYALRNENQILYVSEGSGRIQQNDPTFGALISTKYFRIDKKEFENNYIQYSTNYRAYLIEGSSTVLDTIDYTKFRYVVKDDGLSFYLK